MNETVTPVLPVAPQREKRNDVVRPISGTRTGLVWDYADAILRRRQEAGEKHVVPTIGEVRQLYDRVEGSAVATCQTQYDRWLQFHGARDALKARRADEQVSDTEAKQAKEQAKEAKRLEREAAKQAKEAKRLERENTRKAKEEERLAKAAAREEAKAAKAKEREEAAAKKALEKQAEAKAKADAAEQAARAAAEAAKAAAEPVIDAPKPGRSKKNEAEQAA